MRGKARSDAINAQKVADKKTYEDSIKAQKLSKEKQIADSLLKMTNQKLENEKNIKDRILQLKNKLEDEKKKVGRALVAAQDKFDEAKKQLEDSKIRAETLKEKKLVELKKFYKDDAEMMKKLELEDKDGILRKKREEEKERKRQEYINPNNCFKYSTVLNRDDSIISDQLCRLKKPFVAKTLKECRDKCIDEGDSCNAFTYRGEKYKGNNCWLKNCDGKKLKHRANLRAYGLETGDKYYQFQISIDYKMVKDGDGVKDRYEANHENKVLCPNTRQYESSARFQEQLEIEKEMLNMLDDEDEDTRKTRN